MQNQFTTTKQSHDRHLNYYLPNKHLLHTNMQGKQNERTVQYTLSILTTVCYNGEKHSKLPTSEVLNIFTVTLAHNFPNWNFICVPSLKLLTLNSVDVNVFLRMRWSQISKICNIRLDQWSQKETLNSMAQNRESCALKYSPPTRLVRSSNLWYRMGATPEPLLTAIH